MQCVQIISYILNHTLRRLVGQIRKVPSSLDTILEYASRNEWLRLTDLFINHEVEFEVNMFGLEIPQCL